MIAPTGDAVLDAAVHVARNGNLSEVIRESSRNLQRTLYERFVDSGMVRHEQRRILAAIFDRWPAQDSRHKVEVRQRVIQALVEQTTPDTRSAAMITLLHKIRHEPAIVDPRHYGMSQANPSGVARKSLRATGRPKLFATRSTQ